MSVSSEAAYETVDVVKSMHIVDRGSAELGTFKYVYEFTEAMVPPAMWKALMLLEEMGRFYFPNVGNDGYRDLVVDAYPYKVKDKDLKAFFALATDAVHEWPRKGSTREVSMKQLANCSWLVDIVEE